MNSDQSVQQRIPSRVEIKTQRAITHIRELEKCLQDVRDHYSNEVSLDDNGILRIAEVGKFQPHEMPSVIVGDAVHNLRCALDYIMSDTMSMFGHNPRQFYFPISNDQYSLVQHRSFTKIRDLVPNLAQFLLDEIKPYKTVNFGYWAINEMDNADKHRLLAIVNGNTNFTIKCTESDQDPSVLEPNIFYVLPKGLKPKVGSPMAIHNIEYSKGTVDFIFGDSEPFAGKPVIPVLYDFVRLVYDTLRKFIVFMRQLDIPQGSKCPKLN